MMPTPLGTETVEVAIDRLEAMIGARVRRDVPLAPYTTYRVGGPAAAMVDAASIDDLVAVATVHHETSVPVLIVGRGSNMLVADGGFGGIVVTITGLADQIELPASDPSSSPDACRVTAGGAVALPVLARRTASAGLSGFEWAVGVPGSVGGAVRMNAGGHGSDMSNCLVSAKVFDFDSRETFTIAAADIGLRFRASSLPPTYVVLDAAIALQHGDAATSEREIAEIVRWRRANQPGGQNCGSVFVNPVPGEVTAGALIDSLGLRGFRVGTSWVSEKHANFIQASENGSAADVRAVIETVRQRVAAETGYLLRSEVRLVGFDDADPMSFDDAGTATTTTTGVTSTDSTSTDSTGTDSTSTDSTSTDSTSTDSTSRVS